jgi:hypothetical protein
MSLQRSALLVVLATFLAGSVADRSVLAQPQTAPSAAIETEIPGVAAFAVPPASFNPLSASDAELDRYGFPPRPNRDLGADVLAQWQRRVMSQTRIVPQLKQTNTFHATVRNLKQIKATGGTVEANSENWSGYAIVDASNPFAKPGSQVEARYVVPKPASGCASGSETYSSANWVGIDGAFSNDVLQAGTETDLDCAAGASYYAWIEWFPNSEIRVTNLVISPGDLISVSAFIASDASRHLSIENLTTRKSVALAMTPPRGTELVGNSIEWIVERPTINNAALSKLTNYLLNPWTDIGGLTSPGQPSGPVTYLPNGAPKSATIYRLWMSDGTNQLSGVQLFNVDGAVRKAAPALWFFANALLNAHTLRRIMR